MCNEEQHYLMNSKLHSMAQSFPHKPGGGYMRVYLQPSCN
jgi:hypothetical protein